MINRYNAMSVTFLAVEGSVDVRGHLWPTCFRPEMYARSIMLRGALRAGCIAAKKT